MRIDASSHVTVKSELVELFKGVEVGDILKGRVLETLNDSLVIRTVRGEILTAMLQDGSRLPKGTFVELIVNRIAYGNIFAEISEEVKGVDLDSKVSWLLRELGLPVDENNIEAAKLLIKYKLPLDKDTIMNISGLKKTIDNLNQGDEEKFGLLLSGLNIKDTPVDVLNKIILGWSREIIKQDTGKAAEGNMDNNPVTERHEAQSLDKPVFKSEINKENNEAQKNTAGDINRDSNEIHKSAFKSKEPLRESIQEEYSNKGAELLKVLERLGIEAGKDIKRFALQVSDILETIKGTDMEAITYLVSKEMDITPGNLSMLLKNIKNSDGISELLDKLQQRISEGKEPELKEIKASIKKLFSEPHEIEEEKAGSAKLKELAELGNKLERYLDKNKNYDPKIVGLISNLKDSMDFIRNINQHCNFLQLPVIFNGNTSTAKLYVFKEGSKNKRINPEDATIVLTLDMVSLGHLESMIRVKGKTANVTFRVENQSIGTFIEKNTYLLKEYLGEKGYTLYPIKVINMEEPFSLISLEAMLNENGTERIHFDMRV